MYAHTRGKEASWYLVVHTLVPSFAAAGIQERFAVLQEADDGRYIRPLVGKNEQTRPIVTISAVGRLVDRQPVIVGQLRLT